MHTGEDEGGTDTNFHEVNKELKYLAGAHAMHTRVGPTPNEQMSSKDYLRNFQISPPLIQKYTSDKLAQIQRINQQNAKYVNSLFVC